MPNYYKTSNGHEARDLIALATLRLSGETAFYTGCMVKYACRWWRKGGSSDIHKIISYCEFLKELSKSDALLIKRESFADRLKIGRPFSVASLCDEFKHDLFEKTDYNENIRTISDDILRSCCNWWNEKKDDNKVKNLDHIIDCCVRMLNILD